MNDLEADNARASGDSDAPSASTDPSAFKRGKYRSKYLSM